MTTTMQLIHNVHIPAEERWAFENDRALMHLSKELGADLLNTAIARSGNLDALIGEAKQQLSNIDVLRGPDNLILTGLLDLTQFGLTKEEIATRKQQLNTVPSASVLASTAIHDSLIDDVGHQHIRR